MERAILIVGKNPDGKENYQLLIGTEFQTVEFDGTMERNDFYQQVAEEFSRLIVETRKELDLGIVNGNRIVHETGKYEKISKLEDNLARQFSDTVCATIERMPVMALRTGASN